MNYIEYVEEEVREEIFEGTYILDGLRLTEEQQREKIFNLMRTAGVEVGDESLLEIGYEGADDDYGISETQSTKFIVTRRTTKKVPYKVTKEEVFEGTFILDGLRLTEEQQREKIFNLMVQAGVEISKEEFDTFEIGYEGADDDYGISETQSTRFVVYKVTKERLAENEVVEANDLEQVLNEIKTLRDKLNSIVNDVSKTDIIQELMDKTEGLERMISNNEKANSNVYTEAIKEIDVQLLLIEKELKEAIKLYEESYEKMRKILEEENERLNSAGLLTDEEYNQIIMEFLGKRMEENERTIKIKKEIEARKKQIASLKRRKNKIKKDLMNSEALGIPASQYQSITNTLKKRKLVNAIFEAKGLEEILAVPSKERTKEQQKKLKEAKEEIIEEIAKLQKSQDNGMSVLDAIEALYGIDTEMVMKGKAKEYKLTKQEFDNLKNNVALLPEKIVVRDKSLINNHVLNSINPTAAPEDMIEVIDKKVQEEVNNEVKEEVVEEKEEEKVTEEVVEDAKPVEMITLFIDDENLDVYARKYVFDRFHLERHSDEVIIDESVCFKMDEEDADWIIENKDNNYSPYIIDTRQVKIEKEKEERKEEVNKPIEKITVYIDVDNNNEVYGSRYLFGRFNMDMLSDEVRIDGKACFRMSEEDATFILGNQDNNYSPYVVETRKIQLGKKEDKVVEKPVEKMTLYIDTDNNNEVYGNRYLFNRFNLKTLGSEIRIDGKVCFRMDENDADYILGNQNNNYSPYIVEIREVQLGKRYTEENTNNKEYVKTKNDDLNRKENLDNYKNEENKEIKEAIEDTYRGPEERIVIYRDLDNRGEVYGRKYLFDRFKMNYSSDEVRIDGALCYRIHEDDLDFIIGNQTNSYSPYRVEIRGVSLGKRPEKEEVVEDKPVEKMVFYRDLDNNGEIYGRKYLFDRFNMKYASDEVRIEGALCYRMEFDDADYILGNQNNNYSPYSVEIRDIHLGKKVIPINEGIDNIVIDDDPVKEPEKGDDEDDKTPPVVGGGDGDNDGNGGNDGDGEGNKGKDDDDDDVIILPPKGPEKDDDDDDKGPVEEEPEDEIEKPKTVRPHVESILDKLTSGLDIGPKNCARYTASNVRVSDNFARELHTGNVAYNVVHFVPGVLKATVGFIRKLSAKLLLSARGKHSMRELEDRLEELTEEELEVLFEEYKGSQLKTDMNNQINPIILDRLRRYGLEKVAVINENIKKCYSNLFVLLGQIKAIEEKLADGNLEAAEISALNAERNRLMQEAAAYVITIKDERKKANDLLSGGVHGLEEDFKAVATKLSYVGFRFAKTNAFDNELQHKLGQFGQGLNVAIANNDYEGIVNNFMSLESLYFENTEIKGNALTRRSVGSKYYTPLAEQFDYRDDPFVRDLLSTIAITSATVSAINAIRVHQIETAQINSNIDAANAHNQATMDQVHQIGNDITGKADDFRAGMEAQTQGDVLGASNTIERAELDMHNWSFTDAYRAADKTGHSFYNQFSDDVTRQINDVAHRYSSGAITQDVALREMAAIANSSHQTLVNVSDQCLSILRNYASSHPQFDLSAVEDAMAYLVAHPDAVANMNNGMVDVVNLGEALKGLSLQQYQTLVSIPSDMLSTLVCACSAATLAGHVSRDMNRRYNGRVEYGNEVTEMMEEYMEDSYEDEEEMETRRRR